MSHANLRYFVYLDAAVPRRYRWTLFAGNNRKIANSGESYVNYSDCVDAINLVASSDGAPILDSDEVRARRSRTTILSGRRY